MNEENFIYKKHTLTDGPLLLGLLAVVIIVFTLLLFASMRKSLVESVVVSPAPSQMPKKPLTFAERELLLEQLHDKETDSKISNISLKNKIVMVKQLHDPLLDAKISKLTIEEKRQMMKDLKK